MPSVQHASQLSMQPDGTTRSRKGGTAQHGTMANAALQQYSYLATRHYSTAAVQLSGKTAVQQYSNAAVHQYSNMAVQQYGASP